MRRHPGLIVASTIAPSNLRTALKGGYERDEEAATHGQ